MTITGLELVVGVHRNTKSSKGAISEAHCAIHAAPNSPTSPNSPGGSSANVPAAPSRFNRARGLQAPARPVRPDGAIHTRSAAVQPTQFPCIVYVFRFVEGERFVPDGIFDVDDSVEAVSRTLLFETEKQL